MQKALFLDRDGVVNEDKNYVHQIAEFRFVASIFEVCQYFQGLGYQLVIITNQSGIGRGLFTEAAYQQLTGWLLRQFDRHGIAIARVYHCPCHPTEGIGRYRKDCFDRKPNPGMIYRARDEFGLDLAASVLVGDSESDIAAGKRAGVGTTVLLSHRTSDIVTAADRVITSLPQLKQVIPQQI